MRHKTSLLHIIVSIGIIICFIAIVILSLTGINYSIQSDSITQGYVVNKDYYPASGFAGNYNGERFELTIEYEGHKTYWYVTEDYYNSVKIGDYVRK